MPPARGEVAQNFVAGCLFVFFGTCVFVGECLVGGSLMTTLRVLRQSPNTTKHLRQQSEEKKVIG